MHLPEFSPDPERVIELGEKVAELEELWERELAKQPEHKAESLRSALERAYAKGLRFYANLSSYHRLDEVGNALNAARRDLVRAKTDSQRQPKPARYRFIVLNAFSIKGELKLRGYHFDRDAHWYDLLGARTAPGWVKEIPVSNRDALASEVAFLRQHATFEKPLPEEALAATIKAKTLGA